eukprot:bmy_20565T0
MSISVYKARKLWETMRKSATKAVKHINETIGTAYNKLTMQHFIILPYRCCKLQIIHMHQG